MRGALAALFTVLVAAVTHTVHYLPKLPERMATHFNGSGAPNGWMTREGLVKLNAATLGLVLAAVVGVAYLIRVLPPWLLNIPNKDYWLAPERRQESARRAFAHMLWLGALVAAFLTGINHLIYVANIAGGPAHLSGSGFVALVVAFLAAMGVWVVVLHFMFPKPKPGR
jgi:uncharacterized membrane protein